MTTEPPTQPVHPMPEPDPLDTGGVIVTYLAIVLVLVGLFAISMFQ